MGRERHKGLLSLQAGKQSLCQGPCVVEVVLQRLPKIEEGGERGRKNTRGPQGCAGIRVGSSCFVLEALSVCLKLFLMLKALLFDV